MLLATEYRQIILPSTPTVGAAITLAIALKAAGDEKRLMAAITGGGIINALLDRLFSFGFDMAIAGAAYLIQTYCLWLSPLFFCSCQHTL